MSRKSWLQRLVQRSSSSSRSALRHRPAFTPVRVEFLEDRTAPATLDWTGAAGGTWSNPGNWQQNAVPSATNNVLNFNATTATGFNSANDIPGLTGMTLNITDANATPGSDFTITGANTTATITAATTTGGVITAAASSGTTATITTGTTPHGLLVGDSVTVTGMTPTGYNGTFTVTAVGSGTTFSYTTSGSGIGAGTVFGQAFGNKATITTSAPHGFAVGQVATISGMTPSAYNGAFPITAVTANTFTYKPAAFGAAGTAFGAADVPVYLGLSNLTHSKTDGGASATNVALGLSGTGATLTDTAGKLFISNPSNILDATSTLNVPTGATVDITSKPLGSLGNAKLNLTGGTINFTAAPPVETLNVLLESWFNTGITSASTTPADNMGNGTPTGGLLGMTPQGTKFLTTAIDIKRNPSAQDETANPTTGTPLTATNNFAFLWQGYFTAPVAGVYQFGTGFGGTIAGSADLTDDYISVYVDVNDDGVFTSTERLSNAVYNGNNQGPATTFAQGDKHKIAIGFLEWTGGEFGSASFLIQGDPTFGTQTLINPGDAAQQGIWSYIDKPANNTGTLTNNVSVSGSSTITFANFIDGVTLGTLTMASGTTLNVVPTGGQTVTFAGTTSLGGNATFSTGGTSTITLAGVVSETAASGITKTGTGTLNLNATNTYTGATTISEGTVAVNSGGLGAAGTVANGTTVASGARLVLKATYTGNENLFLNGTGTTATNGAFATDGTATDKTFPGPITLQSNSWIANAANTLTLSGGITMGANQLTTAGAGTITVATTPIVGSGKLIKVDAGTTRLNVASPAFTGDANVNAGVLRVSVDGALGTVAGATNVASGATLRFDTLTTYTALEPFNIVGAGAGGVGAIQSQTNNVTLNSPLTLGGSTTIGSGTAGFKLTLNGAISMPLVSDLSFTGAGNLDVAQPFGNGSAPVATNRVLKASYLHDATAARNTTNLTVGAAPGNTGLADPAAPFEGSGFLFGALNLVDAGGSATTVANSFSNLFNVNNLDITNFNVYFVGQMTVTAPGVYRFAFNNQGAITTVNGIDAQATLYIDLDKNGIFDDATNEMLINTGTAANMTTGVPIAAGTYNFAVPFTNGTGSGGLGLIYSSDDGATYQFVDPSKGTVANTSFTSTSTAMITPKNNVIMNGTGTVTLLGTNTYNGTTTINSGTLAAATAGSLGATTGVAVKSGGSLGLQGGVNLTVPLSIVGPGAGGAGAINNLGGTNTIAGPLSITGTSTIGSAAGTLSLNSAITLAQVADLTFTGAGNTTVAQAFGNGFASVVSNGFFAGFLHDTTAARTGANMDLNNNGGLATPGRVFEGTAKVTGPFNYVDANTPSTGAPFTFGALFGVPNMDLNTLNTYFSARMHVTTAGTYQFGFGNQGSLTGVNGADASASLYLDINQNGIYENATERLLNNVAGTTATGIGIPLAPGDYNIAIPETNGSGGAFLGVVFSPDDGLTWKVVDPSDPSQAGMWSTVSTPVNNVTKSGAGTLTFMASNTYGGNTTVSGGTLVTTTNNGLGANPSSTLSVSGATTALNLFNSASAVTTVGTANFVAGSGTVNTGALGGKLAIKNQMKLGDGYTITGDMTVQGASVIDNAAPRTLTAVTGTLDVSRTVTAGGVDPAKGQLVVTAVNQNNTVNYTADPSAKVLIVAIGNRSGTINTVPSTVPTYGGQNMTLAVNALATNGTFTNAYIYYMMNPPVGQSLPLVVNWNVATSQLTTDTIEAFTLSGIDTTIAPSVGSRYDFTSLASITLTANAPTAGGVAVTVFNYRKGTGTTVTETYSSGTPITGGIAVGGTTAQNSGATSTTTPASGNLWIREDANLVVGGGVITGISAGTFSVTNTAYLGTTGTTPIQSGSFFSGAIAIFTPLTITAAIDLPNTNIALTNGANLSVNVGGPAKFGNISYTGNAGIIAGANPPTGLTIGGLSGPSTGTLSIANNLGLKFSAGSTVTADITGTTAFDQVNVNGAVDLTGAALSLTAGFSPSLGSTYKIIDNDGSDPVTGTFTGLAQGATVSAGAANYSISYTGGDGNDVVLTALAASTATTTTLVANPQATTGGQLVTFTATIAPSPGASGTVTFLDNNVAITGGSNVAVVGGQAVFSISTLAVGVHPVTASYSGGGGFAPSTSTVQNVTITSGAAAPAITSITVDGSTVPAAFQGPQRSRVVGITVVFNQAVQLDAGAMALALHTNSVVYNNIPKPTGMGDIPANVNVATTDNITWAVSWSGAGTETGVGGPGGDTQASLTDGVYDLNIAASKVHPLGSPGVNMASNSTTTFHRLFGDLDSPVPAGDGSVSTLVNTGDNIEFRTAFNRPAPDYKAYFDSDGSGVINTGDNIPFRDRFNLTLSWKQ